MLHLTAITAAWLCCGTTLPPLHTDELEPASAARADETAPGDQVAIADAELEDYRAELLELAFEAVSAMPTVPHSKNRARAQEKVVLACFELDQPRRALEYSNEIDNWRRGTCYADLALYCARVGACDEAQHYLDRAIAIAADPDETGSQEWRGDRIRAKVAEVHWYLGQPRTGLAIERGIGAGELSQLAAVRASNMREADVESWLASLDGAVEALNFDQSRAAMELLAALFDRYYDEPEKRARIERKLRAVWSGLPPQVRIDMILELAETALLRGDSAKVLELVEEGTIVLETFPWNLEDRIPVQARFGELRFRAGDQEGGRVELESAWAMFESDPTGIVDIYRPDALRPLAEAFHGIGDGGRAREVYLRALVEGVQNVNSWPRSEDLAATCCSMAVRGFEPDEELWERIRDVRASLGPPW